MTDKTERYEDPYAALRSSKDCQRGHHAFCSGQRYIGLDQRGKPQYGRCRCGCHR